jgi:caffeoyl-CoA O-methyltransferase
MRYDRGWLAGPRDVEWIEDRAAPVSTVMEAIETAATGEGQRVPIVDRETGRVLAALAAGRRRIVEVGTAFGFSTLWLALGQPADGTIVTIDPDRTRTDRARAWWREAGIADERITVVNARALDAFASGDRSLTGPFDLVFIDALKPEYGAYLDAVVPRLAPGALVLADNVLWSGRVADPTNHDADTVALRAFDEKVLADPRFQATILTVGDGLLVAGYRG